MHSLYARLLPAMLSLGSGSLSLPAPPPPAPISLLSARAFPTVGARLTLLPSSSLAGGRPGPVLRLSDSTELTGGRILTSFRLAVAYNLTSSVSLVAGPSVSKLDLPEGRVRAYEGLAFVRFKF
jgi:hypothetical protein